MTEATASRPSAGFCDILRPFDDDRAAPMTIQVLQSRREIIEGRRALRHRRLSSITPAWRQWLLRYRLANGINVGDNLKSWDVLKAAEFLEARVPRDAPILDIGAFASEIPPLLHRLGYRRLAGIDLNPDIARMPFAEVIDYVGNAVKWLQRDVLLGVIAVLVVLSAARIGLPAGMPEAAQALYIAVSYFLSALAAALCGAQTREWVLGHVRRIYLKMG